MRIITQRYELTKAFHKGKLIYVCSWCIDEKREFPLHWLKEGETPIPYKYNPDYQNYSHGICKNHYQEQMGRLEEKIEKNREVDWDEVLGPRVIDMG